MDRQAEPSAPVVDRANYVVVDGGKNQYSRRKLRLKLGLIVACAVAAVAIVLVGFWLVDWHKNNQTPPIIQIHALGTSGKYAATQSLIARQVNAASTPKEKSSWYTQAYTTAVNARRYDEALTYAQDAYKTMPNSATAYGVAQVYEVMNNKVKAQEYLEVAISKLDRLSRSYQLTLKQYQHELAGL